MYELPENIRFKFFKFISNDITTEEFEEWLYETQKLEYLLEDTDYLNLISLKFRMKDSRYEIIKIIEKYIIWGEYETWKLQKLLDCAIQRKDLPNVLMIFYDLYCDGLWFLDNLALGYGLMIANPLGQYGVDRWEEMNENKKESILSSLYPGVVKETQKVLDWLNEEKVLIHYDAVGKYSFTDNRTESEKEPSAYKRAKPDKTTGKKWWKLF